MVVPAETTTAERHIDGKMFPRVVGVGEQGGLRQKMKRSWMKRTFE